MERTAPRSVGVGRAPVGSLVRVGALAALLSAGANAIVVTFAASLWGAVMIPPDETVTVAQVSVASVGGSIGAAAAFGVIARLSLRPVLVFWGIAAVALLVSFVPIAVVGAAGSSAATLASMHVVAAVTNVGLLTRWVRREEGAPGWVGGWREGRRPHRAAGASTDDEAA